MKRPSDTVEIRPAAIADAGAFARIYNFYVGETTVTFEEEPVADADMADRLEEVRNAALPWLAAEQGGRVVGYACATKWKARHGYRFSAEVSVYLDHDRGGRGVRSLLYARLLEILQAQGYHAVMGGVALPNEASVALHEKFGFQKVAHFRENGFKFGQWIDVAYWEKIL
ncbi:MAG: N-acetyltransferase family protein [Acidobacteriota bacterium]